YTSLTACHSILIFSLRIPPPPKSTLFPYTTLFRSRIIEAHSFRQRHLQVTLKRSGGRFEHRVKVLGSQPLLSLDVQSNRTALTGSEEHTSELQSQSNLVCRLLLEKKKKKKNQEQIR